MDRTAIETRLMSLGVAPNLRGFELLTDAVMIYKPGMKIMRELYTAIAQEHGTTPLHVERAIRHAIGKCVDNLDYEGSEKIFCNIVSPNTGQITISGFIATVNLLVKQEARANCAIGGGER